MSHLPPYAPRAFRHDGLWTIDGLIFKAYLINVPGRTHIPPDMLTNAKAYIELTLPAIRTQEREDHALGYVILHAGEEGNWLLVHWWAHKDIAMRMLASAEIGKTQFKSEDHRRFHACVWEHVVINHERDAWVEEMMRDGGNASDYLGRVMLDGQY